MEPAVLSKFYLWWVISLKSFPKEWTASDMTACLDARGFPELRHLAWLSTFSKPSFMDSEGSSSEHANSSTSLSKISIWDRHPILSNIKGAKYLRVRDALTPSLSCWGPCSWHQFLDFKVNLPFAVVTCLFRSWSSLFFSSSPPASSLLSLFHIPPVPLPQSPVLDLKGRQFPSWI